MNSFALHTTRHGFLSSVAVQRDAIMIALDNNVFYSFRACEFPAHMHLRCSYIEQLCIR